MNSPEIVGQIIKQRRQQLKLSQQDLANQLFVSTAAISKWERGESYPDILIVDKLTNIFGLTFNDIFMEKSLETSSSFLKQKKEKNFLIFKAIFAIIVVILFCIPLFFGNINTSRPSPEPIISYDNRILAGNITISLLMIGLIFLLFLDEISLAIHINKSKTQISVYHRRSSILCDTIIAIVSFILVICSFLINFL